MNSFYDIKLAFGVYQRLQNMEIKLAIDMPEV
jgi:hypothetical protein